MHREAILEIDLYQSIADDLTAYNFRIHNVVETGLRPLSCFPMGHELSVSKNAHRRLNCEIDATEGELEIELTNADLGRELTDDWLQVEFFGDSMHLSSSNSLIRRK